MDKNYLVLVGATFVALFVLILLIPLPMMNNQTPSITTDASFIENPPLQSNVLYQSPDYNLMVTNRKNSETSIKNSVNSFILNSNNPSNGVSTGAPVISKVEFLKVDEFDSTTYYNLNRLLNDNEVIPYARYVRTSYKYGSNVVTQFMLPVKVKVFYFKLTGSNFNGFGETLNSHYRFIFGGQLVPSTSVACNTLNACLAEGGSWKNFVENKVGVASHGLSSSGAFLFNDSAPFVVGVSSSPLMDVRMVSDSELIVAQAYEYVDLEKFPFVLENKRLINETQGMFTNLFDNYRVWVPSNGVQEFGFTVVVPKNGELVKSNKFILDVSSVGVLPTR